MHQSSSLQTGGSIFFCFWLSWNKNHRNTEIQVVVFKSCSQPGVQTLCILNEWAPSRKLPTRKTRRKFLTCLKPRCKIRSYLIFRHAVLVVKHEFVVCAVERTSMRSDTLKSPVKRSTKPRSVTTYLHVSSDWRFQPAPGLKEILSGIPLLCVASPGSAKWPMSMTSTNWPR